MDVSHRTKVLRKKLRNFREKWRPFFVSTPERKSAFEQTCKGDDAFVYNEIKIIPMYPPEAPNA
jgi:hypothetical protein